MYFLHDLAPFGAQRTFLYTIMHLDKNIFDTSVCSLWHDESLINEFEKYGAQIFLLRAKRFFDISAWYSFFQILKKFKPDIIHTTIPELGVATRLFKLIFPSIKLIHTFQNPLSSESFFWRFLNKNSIGMCDAVIFSSIGITDEVLKAVPRIKNRYSIIQNSVTLSEHSRQNENIRDKFNISDETNLIVCNGRLTAQKGQEILLAVMDILLRKGIDIKLMLVGDGDMEDALKKRTKALNIEDSVIFAGRRNDIPDILDTADLYAAPSRWESFNIALGEAMLAGVPCVASDIPGHRDLAQNRKTAFVVKANDPAGTADAIEWVLNHAQDARTVAETAKNKVMAEFTPEEMGKKYQQMYLIILK